MVVAGFCGWWQNKTAYVRVLDLAVAYLTLLWYTDYQSTLHLRPTSCILLDLTGYEPRAHLTLQNQLGPRLASKKKLSQKTYPHCLIRSHRLGNLLFPFPIGSHTSFTSKEGRWLPSPSQSLQIERQKNTIASSSKLNSVKGQRDLYLPIELKIRELCLGTCGPIYITK